MFNSLNFKVILFGFIFTFFSSFGQSFFLGLFNPSIRETLSISHGQFGTIYASATLLSSFILVWVGKKIDDMNIIKFASYVVILLSISRILEVVPIDKALLEYIPSYTLNPFFFKKFKWSELSNP